MPKLAETPNEKPDSVAALDGNAQMVDPSIDGKTRSAESESAKIPIDHAALPFNTQMLDPSANCETVNEEHEFQQSVHSLNSQANREDLSKTSDDDDMKESDPLLLAIFPFKHAFQGFGTHDNSLLFHPLCFPFDLKRGSHSSLLFHQSLTCSL